jgi:hypothetical protein
MMPRLKALILRDLDVHLETRSHPWNAVDDIK